jgi:hypothetical protein
MPVSDLVKALFIGGGALALTGGLVVVANKAAAAGLPPQGPTGPMTSGPAPATQWVTGHTYEFAAPLPQGVTDASTLAQQLGAAGWSNVTILWPWAPLGVSPHAPPELAQAMARQGAAVSPGSYVAQGTFLGATIPVPAGVVSVEIGVSGDSSTAAPTGTGGSSSTTSPAGAGGSSSTTPPGGGSSSSTPGGGATTPPATGILPAATQWVPGLSYEFAAPLDPSLTDGPSLQASLQTAGWHDVTVMWPWAPLGVSPHAPPELAQALAAQGAGIGPGSYVAQGVYLGPSILTVPPGVVSVQVADLAGTGQATAAPGGPPVTPQPPTPPTTTPQPPATPAATATWVETTGQDIQPGDRVRMTIQDADYQAAILTLRQQASDAAAQVAAAQGLSSSQIAQAAGAAGDAANVPPGTPGCEQWVESPHVVALIGASTFCWGPGDVLPVDWPAAPGQVGAAGWHFEFVPLQHVYMSALLSALGVAAPTASGVPVFAWTAQGTGAAAETSQPTLTWSQVDQLQPGDHVRATMATANFLPFEASLGINYWTSGSCNSLLSLVQQSQFIQALGTPHVLVWCGPDYLPPDWPLIDDLSGYHFEFRYAGPTIQVNGGPFPFSSAWIAS